MLNNLVITSLLCAYSINGFSVTHSSNSLHVSVGKESTALWSSEVDDEPAEEPVTAVESCENDLDESFEISESSSDDSEDASKSILALLGLASSTSRGEFATPAQKAQAEEWIKEMESANPTAEPTNSPLSQGTWELVYSDTQLFRSSPFFMAGRAVCTSPEQAEQYDWFCDMHRGALAISQIGAVRQIISGNRLVSEFEVKAGAVPFLSDFTPFAYSGGWPVTIEGAIVSSADITPTGSGWEIFMDTVEIKGSNLPGLRQVLDNGLKLESRLLSEVLENNIDSYSVPKPIFETTYLSETLRVSRDQDGKVFVYTKASDSTEPKDYASVMSDLGVTKLLEGFNDVVTKFYI
eukprot:CAMPEP_0178938124 /NCGR_PEP_ID=MMETSP0786-20121207/26158_1 /TAXON_ID=186022 /ORGANISM="Thalassionema frauenfeldii, Strain CCMP 1798" /LENGTH=350 /DNA_ID=CAMNT_0020616811 /DNA_START=86 /DNA_END=1138 /DNA_ORIENTATION=+